MINEETGQGPSLGGRKMDLSTLERYSRKRGMFEGNRFLEISREPMLGGLFYSRKNSGS